MSDWQSIDLGRPLLLEASAGTGKTFAIEHLVLRALWERRVSLDAMLIMTYTRAAAEDMRARILARLQRALGLMGPRDHYHPDASDDVTIGLLHRWLELPGSPPTSDQWFDVTQDLHATSRWRDIRQTLLVAVGHEHRAWVGTTHSLCQRILGRYQLESGVLDSQDISARDNTMQKAVEAWWLQQFCHLAPEVRAWLPGEFCTVQMWHDLARTLPRGHSAGRTYLVLPYARLELRAGPRDPLPDARAGGEYVALLRALDAGVLAQWQTHGQSLRQELSRDYVAGEMDRNRVRAVEGFDSPWDRFAHAMDAGLSVVRADGDVSRLFTASWLSRPIYKKANAAKNTTLPNHKWVVAWSQYLLEQQRLQTQLQSWCVEWFAYWVLDYMARHRTASVSTFDQLSQRVLDALTENPQFAERLRRDFPFAVVDEFQDTDPVQWGIVRTLYCQSKAPGALVLVGDPKQAIYSFRGADLACYGDARASVDAAGAGRVVELRHNRRSSQSLVAAFNALFSGALWDQAPQADDIRSHPTGAASYVPALAVRPDASQLPAALEVVVSDQAGKRSYTGWVADQIAALLRRDATASPASLAVITQKNAEAEEMYEALLARGLPAQLQRSTSVWASAGARYAQKLLELLASDAAFVDFTVLSSLPWQSSLRSYDDIRQLQHVWTQIGLYGSALRLCGPGSEMVSDSWDRRGVRHWVDFLHTCELCDRHLAMHGPQAVLRWLSQQRSAAAQDPFHGGDDAQVRQSAGADGIRVMTAHGSKGLEFDYVFVPFAYRERSAQDRVPQLSELGDHGPERHLYLAHFNMDEQKLELQSQRENLRLLYVAITRARRYVWMGWQRSYPMYKCGPLPHLLSGRGTDTSVDAVLQRAAHAQTLGVRISTQSSYLQLPERVDPAVPAQIPQPEPVLQRLDSETLYHGSVSSFTALHAMQQRHEPGAEPGNVSDGTQGHLFAGVPRGARGGLFVHAVLESMARDSRLVDAAMQQGEESDLQAVQSRLSPAHGLADGELPTIRDWQSLLAAPLGMADSPRTSLAEVLQRADTRWPEVDFSLSAPVGLSSDRLPAHLAPVFRDLPWPGDRIEGQMDLVVRWQGRWCLMDYKTNALATYGVQELELAMQRAGYRMQAWIYWTALVRHAMRVDAIGQLSQGWYEASMGEILYLFVRGMHLAPQQGVWRMKPPYEQVQSMLELTQGRP